MSAPYVVETSGLTKRFGDRVAVDQVDLVVPRGSAFGSLGPNGAGKTTLIRLLLGLTRATAGTMRLLGRPVPAERAAAVARVGAIVEEPRFHRYRTGRENLAVLKVLKRRPDRLGSGNDSGSSVRRRRRLQRPSAIGTANSTLGPMAGGASRPRVDPSPTVAKQEEK
jgi:ABC-type multidrug transport system ATPase subunit